MPFSARSENVKLGKGSFMIGLWENNAAPSAFDFAGNCNSVSMSADVTKAELFSSTEKSGSLIDSRPLRTAYNIAISMNEFTKENLALFLLGELAVETQDVNASYEITISDIEIGKYYPLGKRRLSDVEVTPGSGGSTPLVAGTDYEINTEFGWIRFLGGGHVNEGDAASVQGSAPALTFNRIRIAQNSSPVAKLHFLCDDANNEGAAAKDELEVWKASVAPDGELNFISDEHGAFSLTFSVLSDATNHPNDPYGRLTRIAS